MKQILFSEVNINQKFVYKAQEFIKEEKKQKTCCTYTNAHAVSDANRKIGVKPNETVEVEE